MKAIANTTVRLAAGQVENMKELVLQRWKDNPVQRNEHFKKYNISAITYDEAYCKKNGEEYLTYLTGWVKKAAAEKAQLLLLPEFCFVPGVLATVHPSIGPNPNKWNDALKLYTWSGKVFIKWLCEQAKANKILIGATLFLVRGKKIYNTGLLADENGKIALRYEKIHLPFDEIQSVEVGKQYKVAKTSIGKVAFSICYDIQFPEHQACVAAAGAQIVLHPSGGYHGHSEATDLAQNRLRVRANDHRLAVVYACFAKDNTGCEDSCVIDTSGNVKACVKGTAVGLAVGDVEIGKWTWPGDGPEAPDRNAFRRALRRPETYRILLKKTKKA